MAENPNADKKRALLNELMVSLTKSIELQQTRLRGESEPDVRARVEATMVEATMVEATMVEATMVEATIRWLPMLRAS